MRPSSDTRSFNSSVALQRTMLELSTSSTAVSENVSQSPFVRGEAEERRSGVVPWSVIHFGRRYNGGYPLKAHAGGFRERRHP